MPTLDLTTCAPDCARLCTTDGMADAYARFAAELTGFCHHRLGDRGLAEEITQEVFVRAWRRCRTFTSATGQLRTWLFAIARGPSPLLAGGSSLASRLTAAGCTTASKSGSVPSAMIMTLRTHNAMFASSCSMVCMGVLRTLHYGPGRPGQWGYDGVPEKVRTTSASSVATVEKP